MGTQVEIAWQVADVEDRYILRLSYLSSSPALPVLRGGTYLSYRPLCRGSREVIAGICAFVYV